MAPAAAQDTFGRCDATRPGGIHLDPPAAVPAVGRACGSASVPLPALSTSSVRSASGRTRRASRARIEQANAAVTEAASSASPGYQAAAFRDGRPEALASYPPATMMRLRELAARTDPDNVISHARRLY